MRRAWHLGTGRAVCDDETLTADRPYAPPSPSRRSWGLCIAWSYDEPGRVGETLVLAGDAGSLGRGPGDGGPRVHPWRIRPGASELRGPLATRRISRDQLWLEGGATLTVEQRGKTRLLHRGAPADRVELAPGDVIELENALVLVAVRRLADPPALAEPFPSFPFGGPDPFGMVGESEPAWRLRGELAFVARREGHVFVGGPSGAGKELAAAALHALSDSRRLVARNAATIPASLAEAELFGNRRDYPNPGMPDRPGLVGEAHGGTLLLDEVGELPESVQAGLLRVLDAGSYQRLGEAQTRTSTARVVGATHRDPAQLKHDLVARFRHRIAVQGLTERPEDVPLLLGHLLQRATRGDRALERFYDGAPRVTPRFVQHLLLRDWETHVRELDVLLWEALRRAEGDYLDVAEPLPRAGVSTDPGTLGPADIRAALEAEDGVVSRAWKRLGLNSRDQLRRLMKKHGIDA